MRNASIESFNGRFREECLDQSWFTSLTEARRVIEAWRLDYNEQRPHTSLRMRHAGGLRRRPAVRQAAAAPARTGCRLARCRCRPHRAGVIGRLRVLLIPGPTRGAGSEGRHVQAAGRIGA
jgi:hypothetical protein